MSDKQRGEDYRDRLEVALGKVDREGLDYALQEGYLNPDDFHDDFMLRESIYAARGAVTSLSALLEVRRTEYGIPES